MLPHRQYNRSLTPDDNSPLVNNTVNIPLNKPLRIATKPPLSDSPHSQLLNKAKKKVEGDGQFNTLPRYNKPKGHTKDSNGFPVLSRISIRSLRPKSQSPTGNNSDKIGNFPLASPPPLARPSFTRGHRREPSWRQVIYIPHLYSNYNSPL